MKVPVKSVADLGLLARATCRSNRLRLDDVAGSANLGPVFVGDVERGKETVQLGRVLRLLDELGIELLAHVPQAAFDEIEKLKARRVKPHKPRANKKTVEPAKWTSALEVFVNDRKVGILREEDDVWQFAYDPIRAQAAPADLDGDLSILAIPQTAQRLQVQHIQH